jgi:hypothetical protein
MTKQTSYMGIGTAIGAGAGAAIGAATANMGVWLALGVASGLFFGAFASRSKGANCGSSAQNKPIRKYATSPTSPDQKG